MCRVCDPVNVEFGRDRGQLHGSTPRPFPARHDMIRVRMGDGWSSDPRVRRALASARPGRALANALADVVDVIAIEVDGVDLAAGRTEAPLAEAATALLRALDRLLAGGTHACVPFEDGAVELVLRRRGGNALLSLVSLSKPARVLAHELEVDLKALADAARRAARDFCQAVEAVAPAAAAAAPLRRLRGASTRPSRLAPHAAPAAPAAGRSRRRGPRGRPACTFELDDEEGRLGAWRGPGADIASLLAPGRVTLRAPDGKDLILVAGPPFLALRDLCSAASRIATAGGQGSVVFQLARSGRRRPATLEVDARTGALSVDGRPAARLDPLALARAILECASDFCAIVESRNSAQAENAHLADLRDGALAALAHVRELEAGDATADRVRRLRLSRPRRRPEGPVAPGRLRQLSFRRTLSAEVGPPSTPALFLCGGLVVACGRRKALGLDAADGSIRWRSAGAIRAALADGALALADEGAVRCLDAEAGTARWIHPMPAGTPPPQAIHGAAGGLLAVVEGGRVLALSVGDGRLAWSFESPGAVRLFLTRFGPLLVAAADTGLVHALDPEGRVVWRLRGPGPLAAPAALGSSSCLLLFRTALGAMLAGVDAATGRRRAEASLDVTPTGPPVAFAGRVAIPGTVGGDALVSALEPDGRPAWTSAPCLGAGPFALASTRLGLLVKTSDGSCALVARDGSTRWSRGREGATAPVGNLPPAVTRGLAFVASDEVEVLDVERGERVGRLPLPAPSSLLVTEGLSAWAVDGEGLLAAARLRGHVSVVKG